MAILQKGYSVTVILAVITFGLVRNSTSLELSILVSRLWKTLMLVHLFLTVVMAAIKFAVHTLDAVY